ncbi:MAG: ATPase AAA [Acidimicrobiales bacterium]|nr:MAG: ATPase AAA [Acidimicrobiales bacterium]
MSSGTENDQGLRPPKSPEDLGVPYALVADLVLRRCLLEGKTNVTGLSNALALSAGLVDKIVQELREKKEIEVLGMVGRDYTLALTGLGQQHANDRLAQSRYAGACPVSLGQYRDVVARQRLAVYVNREMLKTAFSDLVIADELLDDLGPALNANGAMFLYGPPGTGKTSIAERIVRISPDQVLVPKAVEVDGQVISVFDSTVHVAADRQPDDLDPRWVLCHRPRVIVGGELTGSMLDLTYDHTSGVYLAPLQMKANNGVMVIDDFGRQVLTPDQLLNRWIVPLDRRIDFLSLNYGVSFEVPFDVKVVLSTNLDPTDLGDEAFFRRIQSKIFIGPIIEDAFDWILARVAHAMGVACDGESAAYLRMLCVQEGGDLRPYLPADVCKLVKALALYEGVAPALDRHSIDRVLSLYYTRGIEGGPGGYGKAPADPADSLLAEIAVPTAPAAPAAEPPPSVSTF